MPQSHCHVLAAPFCYALAAPFVYVMKIKRDSMTGVLRAVLHRNARGVTKRSRNVAHFERIAFSLFLDSVAERGYNVRIPG